ncbi:DNA ligase 1-like isoform X1 [Hibiscus syriacus]|uniref:DNA ligase 1-like isoform X1 n=1 Tax=Hibiscus syriacus TaxID=106335 RepID=A0A6A3CZP9_HIBSY|nr:DNA ligase 1-like isoform X1 [Hibiscus syriacus]
MEPASLSLSCTSECSFFTLERLQHTCQRLFFFCSDSLASYSSKVTLHLAPEMKTGGSLLSRRTKPMTLILWSRRGNLEGRFLTNEEQARTSQAYDLRWKLQRVRHRWRPKSRFSKLPDLKHHLASASQSDSCELPRGVIRGRDNELGGAPLNSGEVCLQEFFVKEAHEESRQITKGPAMKAIKERMEKDVAEVGRIAHFVKGKFDELDRDVG